MSNQPIHIEYILEDHCQEVIQFSPTHITWTAYDRTSALLAAATLLAKGMDACFYTEHQAWYVQAYFH